MKPTVGSRELKNRLGRYLRQVREGRTLVVTDRGRPVAELRPLPPADDDDHAALSRLAADGLVSPPSRPRTEIEDPRPTRLSGESLSETVLAEREDRL